MLFFGFGEGTAAAAEDIDTVEDNDAYKEGTSESEDVWLGADNFDASWAYFQFYIDAKHAVDREGMSCLVAVVEGCLWAGWGGRAGTDSPYKEDISVH